MILKGKYKKSKIYLNKQLDLKDNTDIRLKILPEFQLSNYFGIMKDNYTGKSVNIINTLRKTRHSRFYNATN